MSKLIPIAAVLALLGASSTVLQFIPSSSATEAMEQPAMADKGFRVAPALLAARLGPPAVADRGGRVAPASFDERWGSESTLAHRQPLQLVSLLSD